MNHVHGRKSSPPRFLARFLSRFLARVLTSFFFLKIHKYSVQYYPDQGKTTTNVKLNTLHILLKNGYFGSLFVSDVLVDGEDEHEHEEEASAAKEVPDVVPDINNSWSVSTRWNVANALTRHRN